MARRYLLLLLACTASAATPRRARRALERREQVRSMFAFGFDSYMRHAWPMDELNPVLCCGRGPDLDASNLNINDVLGNYSLTLIDSLDTLAVMGNASAFGRAVRLVASSVSFDKDVVVQVFEATIRVLGGLLSAHVLLVDPDDPFHVQLAVPEYRGELLHLAYDLGRRLLPAFEQSKTGIPHPRVNLRKGVPRAARTDTNTAGAGSLSLEFGMLSRLSGDAAFEEASDRAIRALWQRRDKRTGLVGSNVDAQVSAFKTTVITFHAKPSLSSPDLHTHSNLTRSNLGRAGSGSTSAADSARESTPLWRHSSRGEFLILPLHFPLILITI